MCIKNNFGFIGHCYENNHDKIWGYFYRPAAKSVKCYIDYFDNYVIFWARRGKALQFKPGIMDHKFVQLVESKIKKGYEGITEIRLMEIWPSFIQEAEDKLMWEILSGKII